MMELRLRKLIAEIQADYWMENKAPYGLDDEEVSGHDLASQHTAEEALHLRSFLRTSGNYNLFKLLTEQFLHTITFDRDNNATGFPQNWEML